MAIPTLIELMRQFSLIGDINCYANRGQNMLEVGHVTDSCLEKKGNCFQSVVSNFQLDEFQLLRRSPTTLLVSTGLHCVLQGVFFCVSYRDVLLGSRRYPVAI